MKRFFSFYLIVAIYAALFLTGCKSDSSDDSPPATVSYQPCSTDNSCFAQKGPMDSASEVRFQELDANWEPTGKYYTTRTKNKFGSFMLGSAFTTRYVEGSVFGYYLNENTGILSTSQITLRAYLDLETSVSVVINIATTLTADRIKHLVLSGQTFTAAKLQAETELLSIFKIYIPLSGFDQMNIAVDDVGGGVLLAMSSIIQQDNTDAQVNALIGDIANDIKTDGTLDDQTLILELANNAKNVALTAIKNNVESYYASLGLNITLTKYIDYIDSDGDGIINLSDDNTPDTFSFSTSSGVEPGSNNTSNEITVSGLTDGGTARTLLDNGTLIVNDIELTDTSTDVKNGDRVRIKLSGAAFYAKNTASLTIGDITGVYTVNSEEPVMRVKMNYTINTGEPGFSNTGIGSQNNPNWFAFPIQPDTSFDAKYMGLGFYLDDQYGLTSIDIYSDNSGVPGTKLTGFTYSSSKTESWSWNTIIKNLSSTEILYHPHRVRLKLSPKFSFVAGTKYWIVAYYSNFASTEISLDGRDDGSYPFSTHKYSTDGTNWINLATAIEMKIMITD